MTKLPALPEDLARAIELLRDRKANELRLLDLRDISTATDYFLLASGTSDVHVKSIADHVIDDLKKFGSAPNHIEGHRTGRWVLVDYVDFVIHVFHPSARDFYQLERLWGDAELYEL